MGVGRYCESLILSPSLSLSANHTLWEVPSCGPVWLPVRGAASVPPAPHGCAFISGTPPQTLPQAHLLIQVRSRAGWCSGGSRKRGVRAAFRTSQTARCGSHDFQGGSFGEWGTLRWDMLSGRTILWSVNPQGCEPTTDTEPRALLCHSQAVWPWGNGLASLSFSSLWYLKSSK